MEFKRYTSIENAYRQKVVNNISQYYPKELFIVQEKIHGANFAFYVDADGVRAAKRSGFIEDPVGFYNADILLSEYEVALLWLFECTDADSLSIHGEIYGGNYPHKDVPVNNTTSSVQGGVFYSPNREFIAFDMKIDGEFINIDDMNRILDNVEIPRSEILFRGFLNECLEYPNEFNSTLPKLFGLPELEVNTCEGTVIKSVEPNRLPNGERLILKHKNAKWSEKGKVKSSKPTVELPEHITKQRDVISTFVTENRLRNVLSKIGPITDQKKAFGQIMKPYILDVIEDYSKENPGFLELDKSERKLVASHANMLSATVIRNNLFNIIDGNF